MDSSQLSGNVNYENDIQPMPTQYETGMPPGQIPSGTSYQAIKGNVAVNLDVFREPRGVMRILQFVFSICAFATTTGFTNYASLEVRCINNVTTTVKLEFSYPFRLDHVEEQESCHEGSPFHLFGNFSSDAQFFVATGVLSFLYCIAIVIVYVALSNLYDSNSLLPSTDFALTVLLAVFWLSGSAAWANGLNSMKTATDPSNVMKVNCNVAVCQQAHVGDFQGLNISVILGFLNFFLWASDLWFLYKETPWFKMKQSVDGVTTTA